MKMSGKQIISASRERSWYALNDPRVLQDCIPGCDRLTKIEENEFEGSITARIGPVKAQFTGEVLLSEVNPPNSYTISGEGKGGVAGFARGSASIRLEETQVDGLAATILSYEVDAVIGGKLAQLGARLIDSTARNYAEQFFARLKTTLEQPVESLSPDHPDTPATIAQAASAETAAPAPAADAVPTAEVPADAARPSAGIPAWLWITVLGIAVALFLLASLA